MVGWIILAVIVGLIVLIMLVPIGADIRYEDGVIRLSVKAAGFRIQLIPHKAKEKKKDTEEETGKEKKKEKEKKEPSEEERKKNE